MKDILFYTLLLFSFYANAQTPKTTYEVATISAMKSYFGAATRMHVSATNEDYDVCSPCTADEVYIYAGAGGRKWKKVGSAPKVFDVKNYGAVADGTTDNTTAFANCMSDLIAAGGGTFYVPRGYYIGKIIVPAYNGTGFITITIQGESQPTLLFGTVANTWTLQTNYGSILKSNSTTGAVISAAQNTGTGNFQGFSNVLVVVKNMDVRTYDNPQINGVDLFYAQQAIVENCFINTGIYNVGATFPGNGKAGLIMPANNNGAISTVRNTTIGGYYNGLLAYEHTTLYDVNLVSCVNGLHVKAGYHGIYGSRVGFYSNTNNIYGSGVARIAISQMNIENETSSTRTGTVAWQINAFDIKDTANLLSGNIMWATTTGNVGIAHTFTKSGGTGLQTSEIGTATTGTASLANTQVGVGNASGVLSGSSTLTYTGGIFSNSSNAGTQGYYAKTTLGTGESFLQLVNDASQSLLLENFGSTSSIAPSKAQIAAGQTNGLRIITTANAPLEFMTNSTGATNKRFEILGAGTAQFYSTLTTAGEIKAFAAKTAAYTLTGTDQIVTGDATSAAFSLTLPTAVGKTGQTYTLKKIDASANAVTVATTSSQTIDASTTFPLSAQYKYVTVISNGANWIVIANN